jgi:hypothetical protein
MQEALEALEERTTADIEGRQNSGNFVTRLAWSLGGLIENQDDTGHSKIRRDPEKRSQILSPRGRPLRASPHGCLQYFQRTGSRTQITHAIRIT